MDIRSMVIIVFSALVIIGIITYLLCNQKNKVIEWLKYAVSEAEKMLGSGTGQLKLRLVYDWFCEKFPVVAAILPFKVFSSWVDIALETFDKWLSNTKFVEYIGYKGGSKHGDLHE